jgi:integrase
MLLLKELFIQQHNADNNANQKIKAVGGKATLYKRPESSCWQVRFKMGVNKWYSFSTNTDDLEQAQINAEEIYNTASIKTNAGLTPLTKTFKQIAIIELANMAQAMSNGIGKKTYRDYTFAINKYLIPFFGSYSIEKITTELIRDFEGWRIAIMGKVPMASTKRNHSSAYIRVINLAKEKGICPSITVVPMLDSKGEKSKPRPAFSDRELDDLLAFIPSWIELSYTDRTRQMRMLCYAYIEFLVNTGIRHGTEALPLRWKHLQWHWVGEKKFLRIWVSGKTGPRYLIAKSEVIAVLERLMRWQELPYATLDELIDDKLDKLIFRISTGEKISNMENIFRGLMKHSKLMYDSGGQRRTLYSLRHTYATRALAKGVDIHTLARQMGTSVLMIEKHYSKITPMLKAEMLG